MKIAFTSDVVHETEGPNLGPRFRAGEVHDMRPDIAERWLRRGVAVLAAEPPDASPAADVGDPAPEKPAVIEIPDDWENAHGATLKKIARLIIGDGVDDVAQARAVIADEIKRRSEA